MCELFPFAAAPELDFIFGWYGTTTAFCFCFEIRSSVMYCLDGWCTFFPPEIVVVIALELSLTPYDTP